MDMTGMVLISLLGYRTDSGFDLKYLGLRRLTVVGWGHQRSRPGDCGGLALSWFSSDCCQVPGSTRSRVPALLGKNEGQFTAAAFVLGIKNGSTDGSLHPKFYSKRSRTPVVQQELTERQPSQKAAPAFTG